MVNKLSPPRLVRSTFTTSRELEYFTPEELTKQIGHSLDQWPEAITKELIDNALDACEEFPNLAPLVTVTVDGNRITVGDNAGDTGLPEDTLKNAQDYGVTVSTKAHYKAPLRGRQGNALKTVWAAPYVYNGGGNEGIGRVEIVTPKYAYEITASVDQIKRKPTTTQTAIERFVEIGTSITIEWTRPVAKQ